MTDSERQPLRRIARWKYDPASDSFHIGRGCLSRTFLIRLELGQHDPSLSTLVRVAKALRVSVTELLGESASAKQWWQVGEARFATREDAEDHARTAGEMFVARYQNKPTGPVRRLVPIRESK